MTTDFLLTVSLNHLPNSIIRNPLVNRKKDSTVFRGLADSYYPVSVRVSQVYVEWRVRVVFNSCTQRVRADVIVFGE